MERDFPTTQRGDDWPLVVSIVAFDGPGVLFDNTIWNRWLFRILQNVGLRSEFEVFFRLWDESYQADVAEGRIDYWRGLRRFLQESGMKNGCIDEVIAAGQSRREQIECPACPMNGVARTLSQLSASGFGLAAIGAGFDLTSPLSSRLKRWRLDKFFHFIESADQPSKHWTDELTARGYSPASTVFLSSSSRRLREARVAGCQTLALGVEDQHASSVIDRIDELNACLSRGNTRLAG